MKKLLLTIILVWAGASAWAQNMYDALRFSENNYTGTARTMAMGNAFTALGGDLGATTINPAGSAVAKYSQVSITPALSISSCTAVGTVLDGYSKPFGFETAMRTTDTGIKMPNIGISFNINTHRSRGVKNISLGFISSVENDFSSDIYAKGTNESTSIAGALASWAVYQDGNLINPDDLWTGAQRDPYSSFPWDLVAGYNGGLFDALTYTDDFGETWLVGHVGVTENIKDNGDGNFEIDLGGPISQNYGRTRRGSKRNSIFNFAMNISDIVYVGANLTVTAISYGEDWYIKEQTEYPDMFDTGFKELRLAQGKTVNGSGVSGKFGFIVTPGLGLRIGAAIETPSVLALHESYWYDAETKSTIKDYNLSESSPTGEFRYRLVSPLRFNAGIAWTFGQWGVISADYELADSRSMFYKNVSTNDMSDFNDVNESIRTNFGLSQYLRAGIELKPIQTLAIRAGYGLGVSPEKALTGNVFKSVGAYMNDVSFGIGYDSLRSFFFDFACRGRFFPKEYITPYTYNYDGIITPEITSKQSVWTIAVTAGFRF